MSNNIVAIGWDNLGDLSKYKNQDEITDKLAERLDDVLGDPQTILYAVSSFHMI